ncbi:MAG: hypothetical protein K6G16_06875 [Lachnospiraceae bacterium]|nr:hypothetical protein [Lachnospiraceae bacterium]
MYDRGGNRGQGMRYQDNGYGGSDGFMDRFSRMGQDGGMYGQEPPRRMSGDYGQGGMGMDMPRRQQGMAPGADPEALRELAGQIRMQLQDMQALYEKNAACVDEIREIIDAEDRRIRMMLEQANQAADAAGNGTPSAPVPSAGAEDGGSVNASLDRIREMLDARAEQEKTERENRQEEQERLAEERASLENARREADARRQAEMMQTLSDLQAELSKFSIQMDGISQNMGGLGDLSGLSEKLSERADATDKNTHDVGVRVYRNVQASMNDYLAKQTSTLDTAITGLNQRMEAMEDSFLHRRGATTPITVAALVTGLVNLGVLVVYILTNY